MKIAPSKHRRDGSAVIVIFCLISILLIYVFGNVRTLHNLSRDIELIDRQQKARLQNHSQSGKHREVRGTEAGQQPQIAPSSP